MLSNTYLFGANTKVDDLMLEAFERIGIAGNELTGLQTASAIRSMNFELTSWAGRGLNLWQVQRDMFQLYSGQSIYQLPKNTIRVLEVSAINPYRLSTGGTPFSDKGGTAVNCFLSGNTQGCIQTAPGGSIGYDFGAFNSPSIFYVGIQAQEALSVYTITVEYSFDGANWVAIYAAPTSEYPITQVEWLVIQQTKNARYWRVRCAANETLKIQQLYFSQPTNQGPGDRLLSVLSRSEYMGISNKQNTTNTQSGYYFDETLNPTMVIWPVPNLTPLTYSAVLYTNYRYVMDIKALSDNAEVPPVFLDALAAGTAYRLAPKFAPDRMPTAKADAQEAYMLAAATNFEDVPLRIAPDLGLYRR